MLTKYPLSLVVHLQVHGQEATAQRDPQKVRYVWVCTFATFSLPIWPAHTMETPADVISECGAALDVGSPFVCDVHPALCRMTLSPVAPIHYSTTQCLQGSPGHTQATVTPVCFHYQKHNLLHAGAKNSPRLCEGSCRRSATQQTQICLETLETLTVWSRVTSTCLIYSVLFIVHIAISDHFNVAS